MIRGLSCGSLRGLGRAREGFPILREKHNSTGLRLVEHVVVVVFNASRPSRWNLGASCFAGLKLTRKVRVKSSIEGSAYGGGI